MHDQLIAVRPPRAQQPARVASSSPTGNKLLDVLPPAVLADIQKTLEPVALAPKRVLHHAKMPLQHIYFVQQGLVSVLASLDDKRSAEVWMIGRGGMVGVPAVLGAETSDHRRVVQVAGSALRMSLRDLRHSMKALPAFNDLLIGHVRVVLFQTAQSGACATAHTVQQRLARWLLLAADQTDQLPLTQDMLSRLLGVRRATITERILDLQKAQVIESSRGRVTILNRAALEHLSCRCYAQVRNVRERFYRKYRATH